MLTFDSQMWRKIENVHSIIFDVVQSILQRALFSSFYLWKSIIFFLMFEASSTLIQDLRVASCS